MTSYPLRAGALACALLTAGLSAPGASAQVIELVPKFDFTDAQGVDLMSATYRHHERLLSIGDGAGRALGVSLEIANPGIEPVVSACQPSVGDLSEFVFLNLSSTGYYGATGFAFEATVVMPHQIAKVARIGYAALQPDGSYLIPNMDTNLSTFTTNAARTQFHYLGPDGSEANLSTAHFLPMNHANLPRWANLDNITYPDGETWTYNYNDVQFTGTGCGAGGYKLSRLKSIVSSRGYAIQFDYASEATGSISNATTGRDWNTIVRMIAYNRASTYCNEAALLSCAAVSALNSAATFSYDRPNKKITLTRPNGEQAELTFQEYANGVLNLVQVTHPGVPAATRTMVYEDGFDQDNNRHRYLISLTEAGRTWSYNALTDGIVYSGDDTGAQSFINTTYIGMPGTITDPLLRQTNLEHDAYRRLTRSTRPEGDYTTIEYDSRGNPTRVRQYPTPGSSLSPLEATAVYPATCTAPRICNQPTSATDRNGNTTDFTYDAAHGGLLTETGPAVNGIRPQTRHEYAQRTPWISNGAGGYVAGAPIWVRTATSSCRESGATDTPASPCNWAGDEVRTAYDYGPNSGPNTLLLRGQTVTAEGSTLRTCYGYDVNGRRISETQPGAGLASCP